MSTSFPSSICSTKRQSAKQSRCYPVESDATAIKTLGTLTEEDTKHVIELEAALKEADPLSKAKEIRLSAIRLKGYADKLAKPLVWVSADSVEKLQKLANEREAAEATETKAADALRAGEELLPGTGDQAWKLLFEAADATRQKPHIPTKSSLPPLAVRSVHYAKKSWKKPGRSG